ncbi:MAG: peptidoglycan DD-metalloendopeptidase family protein [Paracoccaceae bacterium]
MTVWQILCAALVAAVLVAAPVRAQAGAADADIAATETAAADLLAAIAGLQAAATGRDQIAALTGTLRSYEGGLSALRAAERRLSEVEAAVVADLSAKRSRTGQLLAALAALEKTPEPLLLLHPDGALGTARSGMVLAAVTPGLEAEAEALRIKLTELQQLRSVQDMAAATLQKGFVAAQVARTSLSLAIQHRVPLPRKFIESPEELEALRASAASLDTFAVGLAATDSGVDPGAVDFATLEGRIPLPVEGRLLRAAGEADAAGIHRPGLVIATEPQALVTAPVGGTLRYAGPLLDYGNVVIIEPQSGYLLVLAGLDTLFAAAGDIVTQSAALGLMGGSPPGSREIAADVQERSGGEPAETLYMELRQGKAPVDPSTWFILKGED